MPGSEDTKESIREAILEVHREALAQEDILGHPSKFLLPTLIVFLIIALVFFYKAFTSSVVLGNLTLVFYGWGGAILIGVILGFYMSYGYRVLFTPKKVFVFRRNKEIFSAPLSKVKFKYDMKIGYSELVLKNEETGKEVIISSIQFQELDKVVDKLKKIKKLYSMRSK